jgi:hypothetical protein
MKTRLITFSDGSQSLITEPSSVVGTIEIDDIPMESDQELDIEPEAAKDLRKKLKTSEIKFDIIKKKISLNKRKLKE